MVVLHSSLEHPSLWWIVVPSLLSFLAGIALAYTDRVRHWLDSRHATGTE